MYQYGNVALKYKKREAQGRPQPNPRIPPQPQKETVYYGISTAEKILYLCSIILVVCCLSMLLTGKGALSQISYEVQYLEHELAQVEQVNSTLQVEIAALSAPDRIIDIATRELGLDYQGSTVRILSNN